MLILLLLQLNYIINCFIMFTISITEKRNVPFLHRWLGADELWLLGLLWVLPSIAIWLTEMRQGYSWSFHYLSMCNYESSLGMCLVKYHGVSTPTYEIRENVVFTSYFVFISNILDFTLEKYYSIFSRRCDTYSVVVILLLLYSTHLLWFWNPLTYRVYVYSYIYSFKLVVFKKLIRGQSTML